MKSTNKVERYDYSKFGTIIDSCSPYLREKEYWGIHSKKGRVCIDTKRYKKVCEAVGIVEFMPEGLFKERNTVYFSPEKIKKTDYKINLIRDFLIELKEEWKCEYKPLLDKIKTPKEIYQENRLESLMYTSCSDDFEEIDVLANIESFKRIEKYDKIYKNVYFAFFQRFVCEIERVIIIFLKELGYTSKNYSSSDFYDFTEKMIENKNYKKIIDLKGYSAFNLMNKVNNFLKHNSVEAYNELLRRFPDNVRNKGKGTANIEYENGMYAGDWLILKDKFIENTLKKTICFFEDYCNSYLQEDVEESKWNYDDYFLKAFKKMNDYLKCF